MYAALVLLMLAALATSVEHSTVVQFLSAVCAFVIAHSVYRFIRILYVYDVFYDHFSIHRKTKRINHYMSTKDGRQPWAVVLNADVALGRGFAEKLAELGFNIALHGRDRDELGEVHSQLKRQYPSRSFDAMFLDFDTHVDPNRTPDRELNLCESLEASLRGLPIKVFVNYTGLSDKPLNQPTLFDNSTAAEVERAINHFVVFPMIMTKAINPILEKEGPSLVLNIEGINDSVAFSRPVYRLNQAILRATTLSMACKQETREQDVEALGIIAGEIAGVGNDKRPGLLRPSVESFVIASLRRVGCGKTTIIPYFWHAVMAWLMSFVPKSWRASS
ncbi:hypothetical protein GGR57DRAFT_515716 [Xylariaceae sp. FL1272]|nr:hypothetical protein GGR57DRAFT_515716 [Xylariaceae sp. FL1272]